MTLPPRNSLIAAAVLFFAFWALCPALEADAFSLGKIRVTGDFNTRFKAQIPVRTDGKEGLSISFGADADYKRLGLIRPELIDRMILEIADHPAEPGQKIVYISSPEAIHSPSFNLVLKATLGGGTIIENYFLAVDFKKNLSLELPEEAAEEKEIERMGRELAAIKSSEAEEDKEKILEEIRREEEELARREAEEQAAAREQIMASEAQAEPAPAPEAKITEAEKEKPAPPAPVTPAKTETPVQKVEKAEPAPAPEPAAASAKAAIPEGGVIPVLPAAADNVYLVRRGDTLFAIARGLGAKKGDYDRAVIALWRSNPESFIRGNIHGLKAGAKLDFNGVNEAAAAISHEEAKRILAAQWPEWTAGRKTAAAPSSAPSSGGARLGAARPVVQVKIPAARLPYHDAVLAALTKWSADRHDKGSGVEYDFENAEMKEKANGEIEVTYTRKERSGAGGSETIETARLVKDGDGYKVIEEEPEAAEEKALEQAGRAYVAHVASYQAEQPARRLVELLRKRGFNAYEARGLAVGSDGWLRVFVDRFKTAQDAEKFTASIRKTGISRYTRILRLPLSLRVDKPYKDEAEARSVVNRLAGAGISAYTAKDEAGDGILVLVGAFESEKEVGDAVSRLIAAGFSCEVVAP